MLDLSWKSIENTQISNFLEHDSWWITDSSSRNEWQWFNVWACLCEVMVPMPHTSLRASVCLRQMGLKISCGVKAAAAPHSYWQPMLYTWPRAYKKSLVQIALCVCLSSGLEVPPSCGQTLAHGKSSGRTKYHQNPERAKNAMLKTPSGIVSSLVRTGYNPVPFLPMKTPLANNSRWWVFGQQTEGIPAAINTYLQIPPPRRSKSLSLVQFLSNLPHGRRLTMWSLLIRLAMLSWGALGYGDQTGSKKEVFQTSPIRPAGNMSG